MAKILKNSTASIVPIGDTSQQVPASGQLVIDPADYDKYAQSANTVTLVTAGTLIVNDGVSDLSVADGLQYLKLSEFARGIRFDNSSNGFTAKQVQAAIEEAKSAAQGKNRFCMNAGFDGSASTGRYLEYNSNVDSNQSGFVLAMACNLREITVCANTAGTVTFVVYKWDGTVETALTTVILTAQRKKVVTGLNIVLASDDELRVKVTAGSISRPVVFQWFEVI